MRYPNCCGTWSLYMIAGGLLSSVKYADGQSRPARNLTQRPATASDMEVPDELLSTRNGLTAGKKTLLISKDVFVHPNLRHLFYDSSDNPLSIADDKYAEVTVCTGSYGEVKNRVDMTIWKYFVCPVSVGARYGSYSVLLQDGMNANVYCCGPSGMQNCCNREDFGMWHGSDAPKMKRIMIAAIVVSCVVFLAIAVAGGICLCCGFKCGLEICKRARGGTAGGVIGRYGTDRAGGYGTGGAVGYGATGAGYGPTGAGYGATGAGYGATGAGYGASQT